MALIHISIETNITLWRTSPVFLWRTIRICCASINVLGTTSTSMNNVTYIDESETCRYISHGLLSVIPPVWTTKRSVSLMGWSLLLLYTGGYGSDTEREKSWYHYWERKVRTSVPSLGLRFGYSRVKLYVSRRQLLRESVQDDASSSTTIPANSPITS